MWSGFLTKNKTHDLDNFFKGNFFNGCFKFKIMISVYNHDYRLKIVKKAQNKFLIRLIKNSKEKFATLLA